MPQKKPIPHHSPTSVPDVSISRRPPVPAEEGNPPLEIFIPGPGMGWDHRIPAPWCGDRYTPRGALYKYAVDRTVAVESGRSHRYGSRVAAAVILDANLNQSQGASCESHLMRICFSSLP